MEKYEQPQAVLLTFLPQTPLASGNANEPALTNDDISLGEVPGFTEGVEDW